MDGGLRLPKDDHLKGQENFEEWFSAVHVTLLAAGWVDCAPIAMKDDYRLGQMILQNIKSVPRSLLKGYLQGTKMLEVLRSAYRGSGPV